MLKEDYEKMTETNMIDELTIIVEKVNNLTPEQLLYWTDSEECFDYLNR